MSRAGGEATLPPASLCCPAHLGDEAADAARHIDHRGSLAPAAAGRGGACRAHGCVRAGGGGRDTVTHTARMLTWTGSAGSAAPWLLRRGACTAWAPTAARFTAGRPQATIAPVAVHNRGPCAQVLDLLHGLRVTAAGGGGGSGRGCMRTWVPGRTHLAARLCGHSSCTDMLARQATGVGMRPLAPPGQSWRRGRGVRPASQTTASRRTTAQTAWCPVGCPARAAPLSSE